MSVCAAPTQAAAASVPVDDLCLLTAVRLGDMSAFGRLYTRHAVPAQRFARRLSGSSAEADDVVAEAFATVLERLRAGAGPRERFRSYLFRTIRNDVYDRARRASRVRPSDDMEDLVGEQSAVDVVELDLEHRLVSQAYASLPDRWRRTLWHTAVEGRSPHEVARLLGSTSTNVTSTAFRARERLRQAYLDRYLADQADATCDRHVRRLGAFVRGGLGERASAAVTEHLRSCPRCHRLAAEVREVSATMRAPGCRPTAVATLRGTAGDRVAVGSLTGTTVAGATT